MEGVSWIFICEDLTEVNPVELKSLLKTFDHNKVGFVGKFEIFMACINICTLTASVYRQGTSRLGASDHSSLRGVASRVLVPGHRSRGCLFSASCSGVGIYWLHVLQKQVWILTRDIFFSVLQIELRKENWVRSISISIRSTRWTRLGFSCWFRSSSVTPSIAFAVGMVHLEWRSRCATDRSRSVLYELFEWWMCDEIHYSSTVLCNDWNLEISRH